MVSTLGLVAGLSPLLNLPIKTLRVPPWATAHLNHGVEIVLHLGPLGQQLVQAGAGQAGRGEGRKGSRDRRECLQRGQVWDAEVLASSMQLAVR